ncbi:MAG: hypothetical protein ACD_58C00283G0003 [uncultured bacterium]|nr:MAG: hypothetical protein ACD_58C00283G0003 [uncultured bacterium]
MNKFFKSIKDYFVSVVSETKKITWPTRNQVINQTLIVSISVIVVGIVFALVDSGFSELVKFIINWRQ